MRTPRRRAAAALPSPPDEPAGGTPAQATGRRPGPQRAKAARARRTRRRLVWAGGLAAVAALIAVLVLVVFPGGSKPPATGSDFVTTFQHGEIRSVPSTCSTVSTATLGQYLPGKLARATLPGLTGNSSNQCDWTLDSKPTYRLLQVTTTAYAPSGLVPGNGSATTAAKYAYAQAAEGLLHPAAKTHLPKATLTQVQGLGEGAFSGYQVIRGGGDVTDRVTLVARFRNVLVTVEFSGLDHSLPRGYGPVSPSELQSGAAAVAKDILARIS